MLKTSPDPIDVQDFQFKLLCKLKVFDNSSIEQFSKTCGLVAAANQYGVLFVGCKTAFQIIRCADLEQCSVKDGEKKDYYRRQIEVDSDVTHLSANCDGTLLAVVSEKDGRPIAQFYDIKSLFTNQVSIVNRLQLSPSPGTSVIEIAWNPTNPEMFTACKSDGSLGVYEIKSVINITELPAAANATCFCWSPKGKQIAVGSKDGKIIQYKPADMKAARVINPPPIQNCHLNSLQWASSYQFIGVYVASQEDDVLCHLIVVDAPKAGEIVYTNYDDICFSSLPVRPIQFYMMLQSQWNILMVSSSNSMEVGVLQQTGDTWTQLTLMDSARAELPLSSDHSDTLPVGLALDTSSVHPLPWGEGIIPPTPRLFLLSHHGVLCCFNVVNLKENIPTICQAPAVVSEMIPSLFTKGTIETLTSGGNPLESPQSLTTSSQSTNTTMLTQTPISKSLMGSTVPPSSTSTFSFTNSESNLQSINQENKLTFASGASAQENRSNIGNLQPMFQGNKIIFGNTQPLMQENKIILGNIQPNVDNKFGNKLRLSNTPTTVQETSDLAKIQQSQPLGQIAVENTKSSLLLQNQLKQQSIPKIVDNPPLSVPTVPKPQAIFPQKADAEISYISDKTNNEDDDNVNDDELNELLTQMIKEECITLESELNALLHQARIVDINVGTDNEKINLVQLTAKLEEFLKEVDNNNLIQKSDVHLLKQNLIQTWAWLEEARSRHIAASDTTIAAILRAQPLDSAAEKQLQHIKHLMYYLDSQLKQAHGALDEQWENFQNYCRKTYKMQLPTMEAIFQSMVKHNAILQKLTYNLKDISAKIKARDQLKMKSPALVDMDSLKKIEDQLSKLNIEPHDVFKMHYERILTRNKMMSPKKTNKLRNFLKQNDIKRISSFKTSIADPKLEVLREASSFTSKSNTSQNISKLKNTVFSDLKTEPVKFLPANSSLSLPHLSSEPRNKSPSLTKPPSYGSAFVPTSVSSGLFEGSSTTAFKAVPTSSNDKPVNFNRSSTVTPLTTASMFGLGNVGKQAGITSQASPAASLHKQVTYSIDNSKPLAFEYPNPMNSNSPVVVIEASGLPLTSTPKSQSHALKIPTNEVSIAKTQSAKSVFNLLKDIEIAKSDASSPSSMSVMNKLSSENSGITITFKKGEHPTISSNSNAPGMKLAVTASQLTQPFTVTSTSVNTSQTETLSKPISPLVQNTQGIFSSNTPAAVTTHSTLPKVETPNFSSLFNSVSQHLQNSQSSTNAPEDVTRSDAKPSVSVFNSNLPTSSSSSIFGNNTSITITKITPQQQTTEASSTTTSKPLYSDDVNKSSDTALKSPETTTTKPFFQTSSSLFSGVGSIKSVFSTATTTPKADDANTPTENASPVSTHSNIFGASLSKQASDVEKEATCQSTVFGTVTITTTVGSQIAPPSITQSSVFGTIQTSTTDNKSTQSSFFGTAAASATSTTTSIFGNLASTTITSTTESNFGGLAAATVSSSSNKGSIFGNQNTTVTPSTTSIFGTPNNATASVGSIFGNSSNVATTTSSSIFSNFGAPTTSTVTTTSSIFGSQVTSSASTSSSFGSITSASSVFGATITTTTPFSGVISSTTPSVFGNVVSTASSPFSTTPTSTPPNLFGTSSATTAAPFGTSPVTTSTSLFSTPATSGNSVFGSSAVSSAASPFGVTPGKSIFGNPSAFAATSNSVFSGQQSSNIFGGPKSTSSDTPGTNVFATQSSGFGAFGNSATTQSFQQSSPFGNVFGTNPSVSNGAPVSTASAFGASNSQFGTASSSSGIFGTPASTATSLGFSAPTSSSTASFGFGDLNVGSTTASSQFGSSNSNPFAKSSSIFGGTPSTQSSVFGGAAPSTQSSSIFGGGTPATQSSSIFGGNSAFGSTQSGFGAPPAFGSTPAFGQPTAFGQNTFGNTQPGPFSGGSGSVSQAGFGSPSVTPQKQGGFGNPPVFGSSPSFGSAPSFGGAPTFGGTPAFGSPGKMFGSNSPTQGFQASTQENSTFANLATQNTVGFGSLAQQAQNSQSSPFSGNSSFSSWR